MKNLFAISLLALSLTLGQSIGGSPKKARAVIDTPSSFGCSRISDTNIGNTLTTSTTLSPGETLVSSDPLCTFQLHFVQNPGPLTYDLYLRSAGRTLWSTNLGGAATSPVASVSADGAFEIHQGSTLLFQTSKNANITKFGLHRDGNFVGLNASNKAFWSLKAKQLENRPILDDKLLPGETLVKGSFIQEPKRLLTGPYGPQAQLWLTPGGEVNIKSRFRKSGDREIARPKPPLVFNAGKSRANVEYLYMTSLGTLRLLDAAGNIVGYVGIQKTSQDASGSTVEYWRIQRDFNFTLNRAKGGSLIATHQTGSHIGNTIYPRESIYRGSKLFNSPGNQFGMQLDGNLVLRDNGQCKWIPYPFVTRAALTPYRATLQLDGNFVIYASQGSSGWAAMWDSETRSRLLSTNRFGILQSTDANFVIYEDGSPTWATSGDLENRDPTTLPGCYQPPDPEES